MPGHPTAVKALTSLMNPASTPSSYNHSTAPLPASGVVPSTVAEPSPSVLPLEMPVPVEAETAGQNTTAKQTVFTEATRIASKTVRMILLVTISIICFFGFLIGALSVAAAFTPAATSGEAGVAAAIFLVIIGSLILTGSVWVWLLAYKRLR